MNFQGQSQELLVGKTITSPPQTIIILQTSEVDNKQAISPCHLHEHSFFELFVIIHEKNCI